jgi:GNAT superfamily N-acetyltransferase
VRISRDSGLNLNRATLRELALLNLPDGNMWPELVARRRDGRECYVYLARSEDLRIKAWALVYHTPNLGGHDFHVYVDPEARLEGYGSALYRAATEDVGVVRTFAPDEGARNFYRALKEGDPKPSAA